MLLLYIVRWGSLFITDGKKHLNCVDDSRKWILAIYFRLILFYAKLSPCEIDLLCKFDPSCKIVFVQFISFRAIFCPRAKVFSCNFGSMQFSPLVQFSNLVQFRPIPFASLILYSFFFYNSVQLFSVKAVIRMQKTRY